MYNILLTLFLWVIIGFCIEEFEGLKSLVYLIVRVLVGLIAYGFYENIKFKRCVEKFIERPYTYDKKKFVDCDMIFFYLISVCFKTCLVLFWTRMLIFLGWKRYWKCCCWFCRRERISNNKKKQH